MLGISGYKSHEIREIYIKYINIMYGKLVLVVLLVLVGTAGTGSYVITNYCGMALFSQVV